MPEEAIYEIIERYRQPRLTPHQRKCGAAGELADGDGKLYEAVLEVMHRHGLYLPNVGFERVRVAALEIAELSQRKGG